MNLEETGLEVWIGFICPRIGQVVGSSEHGNEPSGAIKGGIFLSYYQLLRKRPTPRC
jgi:hypothetical protein